MKLHYFKADINNFGDDLNPWIWERVLPNFFDEDQSTLLVGIGTILHDKLPKADNYIVLGSGYGYGGKPTINDSWDIISVRGKETCKALNLDESLAIIDPAYLLKNILTDTPKKKHHISLIPHAESLEQGPWKEICADLRINLIDARTTDIEHFVKEIKSSELILCEAMHGAIISDCFSVPWCGYKAYTWINSNKWNDWLSVFNRSITLNNIDTPIDSKIKLKDRIKNIIKQVLVRTPLWKSKWVKPQSSKITVMNQLQALINQNNFSCSSSEEVNIQIALLNEKIASLKHKYSK